MTRSYHIWTIGCQMNEADSRNLASQLEAAGFAPAGSPADADVVVLNTCVVRQQAEDKIYDQLKHAKGIKRRCPHATVAVMGCLVGRKQEEELRKRFPFVDVLMPPSETGPLLDYLEEKNLFPEEHLRENRERALRDAIQDGDLPLPRLQRGKTVTALVPIVLGCSHACSFCVIPYRRGAERSRPKADVLKEVRHLAHQGVREVTLLGQIVDRYGLDLGEGHSLAKLLADVSAVEGLERIRFLTSHPDCFTDELLNAVVDVPKVCPHVELPFQAGNDEVLSRMRRGYTADDYRRLVERIRHRLPSVGLGTDVIVGFPGESDAAFLDTYRLMAEIGFDMVHIAKYSERPQTLAARTMPDDVPEPEKERRRQVLEDLLATQLTERHRNLLGQTVEVLAEERQKNGRWRGRTPQNKIVFFEDEGDRLGQLVNVTIEWTGPFSLIGRAEERAEG